MIQIVTSVPKINGVCGSGTTPSIDPRGSFTASVSPSNKRSNAGFGSASVNVSGCSLPTSQDCVRKSRSQGGIIFKT